MTMELTNRETAYATWLNIFGSDPVRPSQVERDLHVMHIMAEDSARSDRFATAYMEVLLSLAPAVGHEQAKRLADQLTEAARVGHVRYTLGLPLMIDGTDCSPANVRHLESSRDEYRRRYVTGDVSPSEPQRGSDPVPHWDGCGCPDCKNRSVSR